MSNELIYHIKKQVQLNPEKESELLLFFQEKMLTKKSILLHENSICNTHYFVKKGCLRLFFTNDKGMEQTIQFAIENWWLTDYMAFGTTSKSEFGIQAIENSEVLAITYQNQEELVKQIPELERYFRLVFQRAYAASLLRTKYLFNFSREEFYHHFNDNLPEFTNRIPQHILASYLNMTPEYLSEIKKKSKS